MSEIGLIVYFGLADWRYKYGQKNFCAMCKYLSSDVGREHFLRFVNDIGEDEDIINFLTFLPKPK